MCTGGEMYLAEIRAFRHHPIPRLSVRAAHEHRQRKDVHYAVAGVHGVLCSHAICFDVPYTAHGCVSLFIFLLLTDFNCQAII